MSKIPILATNYETTMDKICPSCGFDNSQRAKFCIECGTLLTNSVSVNKPQILHPQSYNSKPSEFETDKFALLTPKQNSKVRDSSPLFVPPVFPDPMFPAIK
ncbi:hypothetical protein PL8927_170038 [Planktothrix serta PCC 8927]|uniref:Zinc-ribbon domain-containing protein n=1 Tax=Planktothrix serta PCC 8927 TaxID=671068 RepID=A0A7Z9BJY5_9CYAN|nr:hypothetical protein PL8927_170038 [Planktothrix serta PCC 8927]